MTDQRSRERLLFYLSFAPEPMVHSAHHIGYSVCQGSNREIEDETLGEEHVFLVQPDQEYHEEREGEGEGTKKYSDNIQCLLKVKKIRFC